MVRMRIPSSANNRALLFRQHTFNSVKRRRLCTGIHHAHGYLMAVMQIIAAIQHSRTDKQVIDRIPDICQLKRIHSPRVIKGHGRSFAQGQVVFLLTDRHHNMRASVSAHIKLYHIPGVFDKGFFDSGSNFDANFILDKHTKRCYDAFIRAMKRRVILLRGARREPSVGARRHALPE